MLNGLSKDQKKAILIIIIGIIAILAIISVVTVINNGGIEDTGGGSTYEDDQAFDEEAAEFYDNYPIISYLPIIGNNYRIDYGVCETMEGDFCIMISANTQAARERALVELYNTAPDQSGKYPIEYFEFSE